MNTTPRHAAANPALSVCPGPTLLDGVLRVDIIRRDTLVQLVQHWGSEEARTDIIAQLDALAEAVQSPRAGELDALLENVETAAAMDDAETRIGLHEMRRLWGELGVTVVNVDRFGKLIGQPQ